MRSSTSFAGWGGQPITASSDVLRRINVQVISGRLRRDRPVMGPPLHHFPLTNAPSNEAGVVALFCMIAPELGFQIEAIQSAFPDCEARRQVRPGKWQRVWIEFEYESRNFALHHHDPSKCDMIVCWRHNWKKLSGGDRGAGAEESGGAGDWINGKKLPESPKVPKIEN